MRYRALDRDGDYTFGPGAFLADNPECVGQAVKTRLALLLGEWFTDTTDGTDWDGSILGERTAGRYENELKGRILETPGVAGIDSFFSQLIGRRLSVQATIATIYGQTQVNL